jgi:hypothetical protein
MPQTQGAAIPGWDLSQYPGTPGSVTTPIALDAQIAALINGNNLSGGDKLLRVSDFNNLLPAASVAAVKTSGVLDEIDFKPIVAVAPFALMPVSRVWTKGNICYVSICLLINPQTTFANDTGIGSTCVSGLPANPASAGGEGNGVLIAVSRWKRATVNGNPFIATVCDVSAAGKIILAHDYPLVGNPSTGYTDFLTISGHYTISLVDAVP